MIQKEWKPFCIKTHLQLIDPVDKAALPEAIMGNLLESDMMDSVGGRPSGVGVGLGNLLQSDTVLEGRMRLRGGDLLLFDLSGRLLLYLWYCRSRRFGLILQDLPLNSIRN